MIVWIVQEYTPGYRVVNEDMEIVGNHEDTGRLVGIYATEDEARFVQEELINDNAAKVIALGVDEIDVTVESYEVNE